MINDKWIHVFGFAFKYTHKLSTCVRTLARRPAQIEDAFLALWPANRIWQTQLFKEFILKPVQID